MRKMNRNGMGGGRRRICRRRRIGRIRKINKGGKEGGKM